MAINKIIKFGLESKAIELRAQGGHGASHAAIARTLSADSNHKFTESSVQRFFASNDKAKAEVVEKSDKLQAKVVEAEINTVEKRQNIIQLLEDVAVSAIEVGDYRSAVSALREATSSLNSLDQRIGKYSNSSSVNINSTNPGGVVIYLPDNSRHAHEETIDAEYDEA